MTFYKIIQGDCLKILPKMKSETIDLVYVDPPFGENEVDRRIGFSWSNRGEYLSFIEKVLIQCKRLLKRTGSLYLHCDWRNSHYIKVRMDQIFSEENFRNEIIWCYGASVAGKRYFRRIHQTIFFYTKSDDYTFNILRNKYGSSLGDYWIIPSIADRTGYLGPCRRLTLYQKPVELLEIIIKASSRQGDIVLDPFLGSGTTMIACKKLGRSCIGIEINPEYCRIAEERLRKTKVNKKLMEVFG